MRTNNFALRLPDSLYVNLKTAAAADNVAMNQYIAVALAEKLSARQTAQMFFSKKAARGDVDKALAVLNRKGSFSPEDLVVKEMGYAYEG